MSTNEGISCEASLLEGLTLDCSYSGDFRFVAEFRRSKVSYWIVDFEDMSIHVSGVVGYPDDSQNLVFQTGRITSVQTEVARLRDPQVERVGELRL